MLHLSLTLIKKKGAVLVFLLFALLFLCQLLNIMWPKQQQTVLSQRAALVKAPLDEKALLFSSALFGEYQLEPVDDMIKPSTLDLTVAGILYSPNAALSQALIQSASQDEHVYQIGDTVPGGAVIEQITPTDVVVRYLGRLERLVIPNQHIESEEAAPPLTTDPDIY